MSLPRRSSDSPRSPSLTPVIIGVVAGIGSLLLLLLLLRTFLWSRRSLNNPLPPVQMLAHERQRQQTAYLYHFSNRHASSSSCSAQYSLKSDTSSTALVYQQWTSSPADSTRFSQPAYDRSLTSLLLSSHEDAATIEGVEPNYDHHRASSRVSTSCSPRPKSHVSTSRRSSMRGAPHHNQVDIILPAPLAMLQNNRGNPHVRRQSMHDQWTPPLSRTTSEGRTSSERDEQKRPTRRLIKVDTPPVPQVPRIYSSSTPTPPSCEPSPLAAPSQNDSRHLQDVG